MPVSEQTKWGLGPPAPSCAARLRRDGGPGQSPGLHFSNQTFSFLLPELRFPCVRAYGALPLDPAGAFGPRPHFICSEISIGGGGMAVPRFAGVGLHRFNRRRGAPGSANVSWAQSGAVAACREISSSQGASRGLMRGRRAGGGAMIAATSSRTRIWVFGLPAGRTGSGGAGACGRSGWSCPCRPPLSSARCAAPGPA